MTVFRDTFWDEFQTRAIANGWVLVDGHRYEPTVISGLTPSGRTFTFALTPDGAVTITVAGRTRTAAIAAGQHEDGEIVVTAMLAAWQQLPVNQR